jgi:GH25 family lysozyme M1 (1,4-beta-N-acetylmuramidase)
LHRLNLRNNYGSILVGKKIAMTVTGIDVSKWNGNWDASKAKAAGAEFVFMKSSQACFVDLQFVSNWKKAKEIGLIRGAYHYLDYTRPARDQADFFADLLQGDPGDLPPVVDYEHVREDNNTILARSYLKEFVERMGSHGYNPIIYTGSGFWRTYGDSSSYWYQFSLWIANYTSAAAPIIPAPWLNWSFWQFSKKGPGALFGSEALDIDVNRFNGTLDELYILARRKPESEVMQRLSVLEARVVELEKIISQVTVPDPKPETQPLPKATVIKSPAPLYNAPLNSLPPIGNLNLDQIVEITESKTDWVRIKTPAGWMELSSIKLQDGQNNDNPPSTPGDYAICRASALNVRSGPGTTYGVVGWIELGQRVKILYRQNNWAQLETPAGWCQGSFLTPA